MSIRKKVGVIGGGISGLALAKNLVDQGCEVTILEGSNRTGGKIKSQSSNGKWSDGEGFSFNGGAEFIDTDHHALIKLCNELGVKLVEALDAGTEVFCRKDGTVIDIDEFYEQYTPIAKLILKDKEAMLKDGKWTPRARALDKMSFADYLQELNKTAKIPQDVLEAAQGAFAAESGQSANNISALQFVNEAGIYTEKDGEEWGLLKSDCGLRVEGGTEVLINKLEEYLVLHGAKFQKAALVDNIAKTGDGKLAVSGKDFSQTFDKVALAVSLPALKHIKGLENLGMDAETAAFIQEAQYTNLMKFSIATKMEVEPAVSAFADGFFTWNQDSTHVSFFVGDEGLTGKNVAECRKECIEKYAVSVGKTVEELFGSKEEMDIGFAGVDKKHPCYASPRVGQHLKYTELLPAANEKLAEHGIVLTGSYIPHVEEHGTSIGFMNAGVEAAHKAFGLLRMAGNWVEKVAGQVGNIIEAGITAIQHKEFGSWVQRLQASEEQRQQAGRASPEL